MFNPVDVVSSDLRMFFWIAVLGVLVIFVKSLLSWLPRTQADQAQVVPASIRLSQRAILTDAEVKFYRALEIAVAKQFAIFPQLALWTVVQANANSFQVARTFNNRIDRKRVDFVLVDPISLATHLVIELDDRSHKRDARQSRDAFVDTVLERAGIKLVRIRAAATYNTQMIRTQLGLNSPGKASA